MNKTTDYPNWLWINYTLPIPTREHKFHPVRSWRLDFAYPDRSLAIEIEGGIWIKGRHTRGSGFAADMEKYNALAEAGWYLLRYTPKTINFEQIKRVFYNLQPIKF